MHEHWCRIDKLLRFNGRLNTTLMLVPGNIFASIELSCSNLHIIRVVKAVFDPAL